MDFSYEKQTTTNLTTMDEQSMNETLFFPGILSTGRSELSCSLAQKTDHV